jgi:hypothetical protein
VRCASKTQKILVDDNSTDETVQIAEKLGLQVFVHEKNYGFRSRTSSKRKSTWLSLETRRRRALSSVLRGPKIGRGSESLSAGAGDGHEDSEPSKLGKDDE